MTESLLIAVIYLSLAVHIAIAAVTVWIMWHGENVIDRLMGFDLFSTLTLAVLVLISLISRRSIYIDVALGLAALSFVGTIALAKYVADEQIF